MNTDRAMGAWTQVKGKMKEQWGKLTDDELDQMEGKWEQLRSDPAALRRSKGQGRGRAQSLSRSDERRAPLPTTAGHTSGLTQRQPMTLTSRRRLRRGESVWAGDTGTTVFSAPLPTTVMADVIVVGAGISGALVTRALRASGRDVVMVDRKRPIMGSTMASTALLQYELDLPLHRLAERIGWSRAARAWRRSARAVQELGDIVRIDRLRCQFAARDSLYVAGTQYGHRALAHEAVARERAGLRATFLNGSAVRAVYGVNRTGPLSGMVRRSPTRPDSRPDCCVERSRTVCGSITMPT